MQSVLGSARALASWKRELERDTTWPGAFYRVCRHFEMLIPVELHLLDEPLLGRTLSTITAIYTGAETQQDDGVSFETNTQRARLVQAGDPKTISKPIPQQPLANRKAAARAVPLAKPTQSRITRDQLERAAHGTPALARFSGEQRKRTRLEFPKGNSAPGVSALSESNWMQSMTRRSVQMLYPLNSKSVQVGMPVMHRPSSAVEQVGAEAALPVSVEQVSIARQLGIPLNGPAAPDSLLNWLVKKDAPSRRADKTSASPVAKIAVDVPVDEPVKQAADTLPTSGVSASATNTSEMPFGRQTGQGAIPLPELIASAGTNAAPTLIVAPQMQSGIQQSEAKVEGDELNLLSAKIKRILEDEARRHGIDV